MAHCKKNLLQNIAHKVVGIRGSANYFPDQYNNPIASKRIPNFGQILQDGARDIAMNHRLVFVGEIHAKASIVAFQLALEQEMKKSLVSNSNYQNDLESNETGNSLPTAPHYQQTPKLHVIMEHFSFEMQSLLDDYTRDDHVKDFSSFMSKYEEFGTEGHDIEVYRPLLDYSRENKDYIRIHAGFIPRTYARLLMKEGPTVVIEKVAHWLPCSTDESVSLLQGTELHYNIFESLITGRSIFPEYKKTSQISNSSIVPSDKFRGIFMAQLLKDVAMANKINELIEQHDGDKFLVIAGNGHVLHYCGVPERVLIKHPNLAAETCVIVSTSTSTPLDEIILQSVFDNYGPEGSNPADYLYLYEDLDQH